MCDEIYIAWTQYNNLFVQVQNKINLLEPKQVQITCHSSCDSLPFCTPVKLVPLTRHYHICSHQSLWVSREKKGTKFEWDFWHLIGYFSQISTKKRQYIQMCNPQYLFHDMTLWPHIRAANQNTPLLFSLQQQIHGFHFMSIMSDWLDSRQ